jgi:hypothetical protein
MGRALFICAVIAASLPLHIACAADTDSDANDIVILSVKPRSPDVKPIAAPVSAQGQDIAAGSTGTTARPVPVGTQVSARR